MYVCYYMCISLYTYNMYIVPGVCIFCYELTFHVYKALLYCRVYNIFVVTYSSTLFISLCFSSEIVFNLRCCNVFLMIS